MKVIETIRDFFGRPAPDALQQILNVYDCSDILDLADMYGEAREFGNIRLMEVINERMAAVIKDQGLAESTKESA